MTEKRGDGSRNDLILKYCLIVIITSGMVCSFCIGIYFGLESSSESISNEKISDIVQCKNKSLEDASYCLRDWISGFYNYTISTDDITRTVDDIKKNGGDCFDYNANLYFNAARQLGFDSKEVVISAGRDKHVFVIIFDYTGYCLLDQTQVVKCMPYKGRNQST